MKTFAITHLGSTLVKRALIVSFAFGIAATGAWGGEDDGAEVVYRYLAGTGMTDLGSVCQLGTPCPTAAMGPGPHMMEIIGEGKLSVDRNSGDPGSVSGSGSYRQTNANKVVALGTWTATRCLLRAWKCADPGILFRVGLATEFWSLLVG